MTEGNFVDYVNICFIRKRRKGIYAFAQREIIEKRGPDGDGGRGVTRLSCGNKGLWTLFHLKFARHIKAGWRW
jgi:GTP-binding protein